VTLLLLQAGAAQGHAVVERHVVPHDRGFADHHAHTVIDKQSAPNLRAGMDFNSRPKTRYLRKIARQQPKVMLPQPVVQVMNPHRVQSRVQQNGQFAGRRRVAVKDGLDIFLYRSQHVAASGLSNCAL
jgi:hypothetical protein